MDITHLRIEDERIRIIKLLKENGVTRNWNGQSVDDLPLFPLVLMEHELQAD